MSKRALSAAAVTEASAMQAYVAPKRTAEEKMPVGTPTDASGGLTAGAGSRSRGRSIKYSTCT